ncbi:hypothetical protein V6Z11_A03G030200 [Gossypium hirsutum]
MGNTQILPGSGHARGSCHETTPFLEPLNQAQNCVVFNPLKGLQFGCSATLALAPPFVAQSNPKCSPKLRCATTNGDQRFRTLKGWFLTLRSHSGFNFIEVKGKRWPARKVNSSFCFIFLCSRVHAKTKKKRIDSKRR